MGAQHKLDLRRSLTAEGKGRFYVETETPTNYRVGVNGRVEHEEKDFQIVKLYERASSKFLSSMRVQSLPGCCGVVVLYQFTGDLKKIPDLIKIGLRAAQRAGYGLAHLTLRSDSPLLDGIRITDGPVLQAFRNGKTNHLVTMVSFVLPQEEVGVRINAVEGE